MDSQRETTGGPSRKRAKSEGTGGEIRGDGQWGGRWWAAGGDYDDVDGSGCR